MTEAELENVRLKLTIEVLLVLIGGIYTGLANSSPTAAQVIRGQFERLRQDHAKIALPSYSPEYSDMLAGEYQEALEGFLKVIESMLPDAQP